MKAVLALVIACCMVFTTSERPGTAATRVSDASSDAFDTALKLFDGVSVSDCLGNNPNRQDCITMESAPAEVVRGIAAFGISDAGQNGGFGAALGKTVDGRWKLWLTSQNPYQLTRLPGEMLVCSAGDGVNLRSGPSPDADVVGGYADGAQVTGEQFVLTEPVDPGHIGYGWYRISAPNPGWLYSKYVETAALNDQCALHNAQVAG